MSGFTGINQFGSLTTSTGERLKFKDIDKDGDGKISAEEYAQILNDFKLDTVEFSDIDRDNNKEISEGEFKILEQQQVMQEMVNALAPNIAFDFAGNKSKHIPEVTTALKDYIVEFTDNYTGAIEDMATMFEQKLPEKYAEITANILSNDPETIATDVVNEIIQELAESRKDLSQTVLKALSTQLDNVTQGFIKLYKGNDLKTDLKAFLDKWFIQTDKEKLENSVDLYNSRVNKFGKTIESSELESLKEAAKQLLTTALQNGVEVKLGEQKVTISNLVGVLTKYKDGESLMSDIQSFIDNLSNISKQDQIIAAATEKAFTDIPGSEYRINGSTINYSSIPGYANNAEIHERGKGWSGSRDKAAEKGREILNNESLKNQMKQQIVKMLESKGVEFSKVEQIFENIYTQSIDDTLNAEGIITGRGARGLSSKGHAYIHTKDLVDRFIETFSMNMENMINATNASSKDLDLIDIDFTSILINGNNEPDENLEINTNSEIDEGEAKEILEAMKSGETVTTKKQGPDYYIKIAETIIDKLKSQMLIKARSMCLANGVEFDITIFETMFNNAKSSAVATSVSGQDSSFFKHSESTLDPKKLVTTFTTEFKVNFTAWVEKEDAANNNQ